MRRSVLVPAAFKVPKSFRVVGLDADAFREF